MTLREAGPASGRCGATWEERSVHSSVSTRPVKWPGAWTKSRHISERQFVSRSPLSCWVCHTAISHVCHKTKITLFLRHKIWANYWKILKGNVRQYTHSLSCLKLDENIVATLLTVYWIWRKPLGQDSLRRMLALRPAQNASVKLWFDIFTFWFLVLDKQTRHTMFINER